jgi:hypothetical protein
MGSSITAMPDSGKVMTMINARVKERNLREEATMFCPKCKAKIGMHPYKCSTQNHVAQGITCCVCGYWMENGIGSVRITMASKRARKR